MRPQLTEQWVITRRIQHQMTSKVRGAGLPALMLCGIRELWLGCSGAVKEKSLLYKRAGVNNNLHPGSFHRLCGAAKESHNKV